MSVLPSLNENVFESSQPVSVAKNGASRLAPSSTRVASKPPVATKPLLPASARNATRTKPPAPVPPAVKAKPAASKRILAPARSRVKTNEPIPMAVRAPKAATYTPPIVTAPVTKKPPVFTSPVSQRRATSPKVPLDPKTALISPGNPFVPKIIRRKKPEIKSETPAIAPIQPVSHGMEFPPIYKAREMDTTSVRALLPPIIRGRKIDPSATVTEAETSAPLYQSSRTARRQSNSGSQTR